MADLKIFTDNIEQKAKEQVETLLNQDAFKDCKVRIMPDVHAGAGCVIGFTADLGDKVIPNIVGVDIGCGMSVSEIGYMDIDFKKLDNVIFKNVPSGREVGEIDERAKKLIDDLICKNELRNVDWLSKSLGTLGGGNHFIEIDISESGMKYLVIHSGSRNLGKQVCEIYQKKAIDKLLGKYKQREEIQKLIAEYRENGREKEISEGISQLKKNISSDIPKDLCYLDGKDRLDYLHDMGICQEFAIANRRKIRDVIENMMNWTVRGHFESIHNYIDFIDNIVRKGSISARKGQRLIIPMNMRDGCIIGIGKGNSDWNYSAPHGAGRIMSRGMARKNVTMEEYKESMIGIYTTSVNESTIDESPMAYKPMDEIVNNIKDTVEIEQIIKPIYNFKAAE